MFETGVRQLRMAVSMVSGRPINPRNVERLVADAVATVAAFGSPGDDIAAAARRPVRRSRGAAVVPGAGAAAHRPAARAPARRTTARSSRRSALDPKTLALEDLPRIPVTTKGDLVASAADVPRRRRASRISPRARPARPGSPAEVWLSRYELRAVAGARRAQRAAARRDPARRLHADQHQLARHRGGAAEHGGVPPRRRPRAAARHRRRRGEPRQPADRRRARADAAGDLPELPGRARQGRPPARARPRRLPAAAHRLRRRGALAGAGPRRAGDARRDRQRHVRDDRGAARSAGGSASRATCTTTSTWASSR